MVHRARAVIREVALEASAYISMQMEILLHLTWTELSHVFRLIPLALQSVFATKVTMAAIAQSMTWDNLLLQPI
jgi:hypothetical protein